MLDRATEDEILRLYLEEGLNRKETAARAFVSEASVTRVVYRRGKYMRPKAQHKISHAEFEKLVKLYESGKSCRQIAKIVGSDFRTVHRRLRFAGVKMRPPKGGS
jgi:transposase